MTEGAFRKRVIALTTALLGTQLVSPTATAASLDSAVTAGAIGLDAAAD